MRNHKHFCIHPGMAAVALQIDQAYRRHLAGDHVIWERERKVVGSRSVHVDGVQHSVRTLHLKLGIARHQQNVRLVAAMFLVKKPALLRNVHGFAGRNIFQEDDRVRDASLRTDNEPLQVTGLLHLRVTDFRIFVDWRADQVRHRPRPFDRTCDHAAVLDCDHLVTLAEASS